MLDGIQPQLSTALLICKNGVKPLCQVSISELMINCRLAHGLYWAPEPLYG